MALTCQTFPDHSTIAAFVSSAKDEMPHLFTEVRLVCLEENLLRGTFFALDGCKLPSNASMQKSGKINDLVKNRDSLKVRVQQLIDKIDSAHGKRIYNRRFGIVEPVFANIRSQKRLNHFALRKKIKVNINGCYIAWFTTLKKL